MVPMDQEVFIMDYFTKIAAKMAKHGYEPKKLIDTIWRGTEAMIKNAGEQTNEVAFWKVAKSVYGEQIWNDKPYFDEFYMQEKVFLVTDCLINKEKMDISIYPHGTFSDLLKYLQVEDTE